ncbi:hypothetical protein D9613_005059 [Agrocybe pediades]|uniref:RING-type domain-containing protein n=1 Tax=Agrocybe pediades TaxID=84607 RepID=A0A8H4QYS1_9AGAR|nr:hypothetical protein D9613_005059 [Agrocybe pediades]
MDLTCPLCANPLDNPTTLHCGHSLCSQHLDAPGTSSCPIPNCAPTSSAPRIPPASTVQFIPAPANDIPITPHRSDVVLNNIIALLHRRHRKRALQTPSPESDSDADDDRHSDYEEDGPRPRKRPKHSHREGADTDEEEQSDLLSHLRSLAAQQRTTPADVPLSNPDEFDKRLLEELTCHICYAFFYQPVTTPCQHTFCAKCLQRSLDYNPTCPICRQELPSYYFQDQPVNKTILSIILKFHSSLYQERGAAMEEEERHARLNTPIFVCMLSFPGFPTHLHLFEPRYRLMLRRCLESPNPRFGMIMPPKPGAPQMDYGTILEIRSVQMLPDGRSYVETIGSTRFRILERGTLDGYMVARTERQVLYCNIFHLANNLIPCSIYDYPDDITENLIFNEPEPSPQEPASSSASSSAATDRTLIRRIISPTPSSSDAADSSSASSSSRPSRILRQAQPTNEQLMERCRVFLRNLQRGAAPWVVQRLSDSYGAMPTDAALFAYWVALVLPIEDYEKAKLLPIKSTRLRLLLVVHWIEQLNNNWYAWLYLFVLAPLQGWVFIGPGQLLLGMLIALAWVVRYYWF